jgi:HEAT repeat protein
MFGSKAKKLAKAGDVAGLLALLSSLVERERAAAANALSDPTLLGPYRSDVIDRLMSLASDDDAGVRGQAIFALWRVEADDALDVCLKALDDQDWMVRLFRRDRIGPSA